MAEPAAMATRAAEAEWQLEYYLGVFKEATAKRLERDLSDAGISQDDLSEYKGFADALNICLNIPVPERMNQRVWEGGPSVFKNCEWVSRRRFQDHEWHLTPELSAMIREGA